MTINGPKGNLFEVDKGGHGMSCPRCSERFMLELGSEQVLYGDKVQWYNCKRCNTVFAVRERKSGG